MWTKGQEHKFISMKCTQCVDVSSRNMLDYLRTTQEMVLLLFQINRCLAVGAPSKWPLWKNLILKKMARLPMLQIMFSNSEDLQDKYRIIFSVLFWLATTYATSRYFCKTYCNSNLDVHTQRDVLFLILLIL